MEAEDFSFKMQVLTDLQLDSRRRRRSVQVSKLFMANIYAVLILRSKTKWCSNTGW